MHKLKLKKNKRGDIPSLIIGLVVVLFVLGIGALVFSQAFSLTIDELKENPKFSNKTVENLENVEEKSTGYLDYLFLFSFIAIFIGLIVSASMIDTYPAMMIIFVIVLIIAVVLAGIFANVFTDIGETDLLEEKYEEFTMTRVIIDMMPILVFIVGVIVIIVLYGKSKSGGSPV